MPKKRKECKDKRDKKVAEDKREQNLEELLDGEKLSEMLKKVAGEIEEDFEERITDDKLSRFVNLNADVLSPSLESVAEEQELGARFFATENVDGEKENDNVYAINSRKYTESPTANSRKTNYEDMTSQEQISSLLHFEISEAGRDLNQELRSVRFSNPNLEEAKRKQDIFEEYKVKTEQVDFSRTTRSPFEKQDDKKYKPRTL